METRLLVAYALCGVLVLVLLFAIGRYVRKKRQFKIRQMGRGKSTTENDRTPTE